MARIKHDDTLHGSKRKAQKQPNRRSERCKHELFDVALLSGVTHDRQCHENARWFIRKGLALTVTCSDCGAPLPIGKAKGRRLVAFALAEPTADMLEESLDAQAESEEARAAKNTAAPVAALDARGEAYRALNDAMDADDDAAEDVITEQTRHDVAAAAARHAELAEFERQRDAEPDPRDEDEEPGDHIDQLCDLVKEAGGTMRLHGEPVTAKELRGAAVRSLAGRLADAAMVEPDTGPATAPLIRVRSDDHAPVDETGGDA